MSRVSQTEIKRWALDASDWLWGTAQGAWNEKQTTSQIIVDAVIGMIPLVGDATAARDLIAVGTRLASQPEKREEVTEWVLLIIFIFALIPVVGGIIKGVGRLLLKMGKEAAENEKLLSEIIGFLNRMDHGNSLKFFRELDIIQYQPQLIKQFEAFADKLVAALNAIKTKLDWFISKDMQRSIDIWIVQFKDLKGLGGKMIPKAAKDLNERLKAMQKVVYRGEWHTIQPGAKNVTYEHEARLVEGGPKPKPKKVGWKKNTYADYQHVEGWPDLRKRAVENKDTGKFTCNEIEAFSGPITKETLTGPRTIYRVLRPKSEVELGNSKSSPWWTETLPPNAKIWREEFGVLDNYNKNNFYIKYEIPAGDKHALKAWKGRASEQFNAATGQSLPGGGYQLFVEFPATIKQQIEELPLISTKWGETEARYGFDDVPDMAHDVRTETLGKYEIETKKAPANSAVVAGGRAYGANERNEDNNHDE